MFACTLLLFYRPKRYSGLCQCFLASQSILEFQHVVRLRCLSCLAWIHLLKVSLSHRKGMSRLMWGNPLMNFQRIFPFQKKELNHITYSNFVHFSLIYESFSFKQYSNNRLVLEWLMTLEYSPIKRKLYGQLYRGRHLDLRYFNIE